MAGSPGARWLTAAALAAVQLALPPAAGARCPALDPDRGVMTMAPLLERTTPAVVNVSVDSRVPVAENPLFADPFFRRFFDLPARPRERRAVSAGSGVVVDALRRQGGVARARTLPYMKTISTGCPGLPGLRGAPARPVEPDPAHTGEGN